MANAEHLTLLKQGVRSWNEWRKNNPDIQPNLEGANLQTESLQGVNFAKANLQNTQFRKANLNGADLRWANLKGADLVGVDLRGANLLGANINQGKLAHANLARANLIGVELEDADLVRTNLMEADLRYANIKGVNLKWINLWGAKRCEPQNFTEQLNTVKCLAAQLNQDLESTHEDTIIKIAELLSRVPTGMSLLLVDGLPNGVKRNEKIFEFVSSSEKIDIFVSQLNQGNELTNESIIHKIVQIIESSPSTEHPSLVDRLPAWSKQHEAIVDFLNPAERIDTLVALLSQGNELGNESIIYKIVQIIESSPSTEHPSLVDRLPAWVKQHEAIFRLLSLPKQIDILVSQLNQGNESGNERIILRIAQILTISAPSQLSLFVDRLPSWVKQHNAIFLFLTLYQQIDLAYSSLKKGASLLWQQLSPKAKILCVYRITNESNINLTNIVSTLQKLQKEKPENDLRVRSVLNLIRAKVYPLKRDEVFENADRLLIQYVVEQAQNSAESLTLEPLLPHCQPKQVKYCEGRPWLTEEDKQLEASRASRAFCPRTKFSCSLFNPNKSENFGSSLEGARLYPECSQHWKDWSLLELLEAVGIMEIFPESQNQNDYVQKISGWVNRINEIRERLKCSVCRQMIPHNIEYAKFLAKFRVTVFSCPQGDGHDQNIYLNECWACGEIIDSRESKYFAKEDGYHICIHCGSGTKGSNIYTQGDSCPNCDTPAMAVSQWHNRRRQCCSCKHSIRLPDERKITGPKCPKCGTRGMTLMVSQKNEQIRVCRSQFCGYSMQLYAQQHLSPSQQWEDEMSF